MPTPPPLTKHMGQAERTLQAPLQAQLTQSNLSFPEWTVLTFLGGPGPLDRAQLIERLHRARIAGPSEAPALIDAMAAQGLIAPAEGGLAITAAGLEVYLPLRETVERVTATLVEDVPEADLEATPRTLEAVTRRADQLLAADAS